MIDINELSSRIIGCAIEVHKALGPGLLESAYKKCLCHEFGLRGLSNERQKPLPVIYKGKELDWAQLLTYLRLSGLHLGLILNFNVPVMRDGIVRIVNELKE